MSARQARRALDARLQRVDVEALASMRTGGYVRAIREALQMSAWELGARMGGVSRQAVAAMEKSERAGTIRLETIRRAAAAMDCQLVYAIVPRTSLEETLRTQAGKVIDQWAAETHQTFVLEGDDLEAPSPARRQDMIDDLLRSGGQLLWRVGFE